jgi:hypothetical protein
MKISSVGAEFFSRGWADRQRDRQTDRQTGMRSSKSLFAILRERLKTKVFNYI